MLGVAGSDAVANHQAKEIGAKDAENAADDGADQPLQADCAQAHLEDDDGEPNSEARRGCGIGFKTEGTEEIRGHRHHYEKGDANDCQIHEGPP